MLKNSPEPYQTNSIYDDFMMQLNTNNPLIQLGKRIPYHELETASSQNCHPTQGRSVKSFQLMAGLPILKSFENLSNEQIVSQLKRNPEHQTFCSFTEFQQKTTL